MPRRPEDSIKISEPFRKRIAALIADEETENGKPCTSVLFAERVGIGKTTVSNAVLYGILPSVSSLIKIADYTAKPLSYILGNSDEEEFIPAARPCTFGERLLSLIGERNLTIAAVSGAPTRLAETGKSALTRIPFTACRLLLRFARLFARQNGL